MIIMIKVVVWLQEQILLVQMDLVPLMPGSRSAVPNFLSQLPVPSIRTVHPSNQRLRFLLTQNKSESYTFTCEFDLSNTQMDGSDEQYRESGQDFRDNKSATLISLIWLSSFLTSTTQAGTVSLLF